MFIATNLMRHLWQWKFKYAKESDDFVIFFSCLFHHIDNDTVTKKRILLAKKFTSVVSHCWKWAERTKLVLFAWIAWPTARTKNSFIHVVITSSSTGILSFDCRETKKATRWQKLTRCGGKDKNNQIKRMKKTEEKMKKKRNCHRRF